MVDREAESRRLLVLAPRGRDSALTCELLEEAGHACHPCADPEELCCELTRGAGAAMLAIEALTPEAAERIARELKNQPPWSDFPFVVFIDAARAEPYKWRLAQIGNVTLLERPVRVHTMITAARAAIRARLRQYQARAAIQARDQFLAMLGHELRNPLGAIRLAVDLMERAEGPDARARQRDVIDRQSAHLARLVDDLLDVARINHGKVRLQSEPTDLRDILRATVEGHEHVAHANGLGLSLHVTGALSVLGDRVRLEQIFGNVLTNALKYTPQGGRVQIEGRKDGPNVVVSVSDTGIGIDESMLGEIFDLFTQADRGLARSQGGMGLGLTLVRTLVALHGGDIAVRSEGLGKGSDFVIRIPAAEEVHEEAPTAERPPRRSAATGCRVLVVDDSEDIRLMVQELLELAGHRVSTAVDGPQAVERLLAERPDIAFIDVGLPGFDGYEVARRVRAELPAEIILVAVTGYGQDEDRARALAAGFDRHLTKPVSLEALEGAMTALTERRSA
jgi:signal transduction histidine kinase/CheY-like chemotaxis protein